MIHLLFPFNAWGIHQGITILAGRKKKRLIPSHMWVFAMVQFWFPGSYTFSCSISFSNFQKFYPMLIQIGIPVFNQRLKKTLMGRTGALSLFCFLFFFSSSSPILFSHIQLPNTDHCFLHGQVLLPRFKFWFCHLTDV